MIAFAVEVYGRAPSNGHKPLTLQDNSLYRVKECIWDTGERFAFTVGPDGLGSYWPVLYAVTRLRYSGKAVGTMMGRARSVALFHDWAASREIDVLQRLQGLSFFSLVEIEGLRRTLKLASPGTRRGDAEVSSKVWIDRCKNVAAYIAWHAEFGFDKLDRKDPWLPEARRRLEDCSAWLVDDLPTPIQTGREGLTEVEQVALLRAIVPGSPSNPFERRNQVRNFALVLSYYELGLRLSEALAMKTVDLRLEGPTPTAMVVRRADDPDDPRARQPLVKTKARPLPVSRALALLLSQWVTDHRADKERYPKVRKTPFLFVSHFGTPLTKDAVGLIFRTLRSCPGVPSNFSPHILRHTWNDRFSKLAGELELREAVELQTRNFLMGWSDTSMQGLAYSRRAIKDEADRLMLRMQEATVAGA
ncbi:MAG: site-specific integrase [Methylorubrum populi]